MKGESLWQEDSVRPLRRKITAKQELIEALMTRVESEKRELEELYQEKKRKELEAVDRKSVV